MTRSLTRRGFVGALGSLALAWPRLAGLRFGRVGLSSPGAADAPLRPISPGIQLYSVRSLLEKDFEGTLAALAGIGYREVEFDALFHHAPAVVRAMLDSNGLRAVGGHVDIPAITTTLDQTIADAKTLGEQYVVVPWIDEDERTRTGYQRIAETFNRAGEKLRESGLTLGYHNHWFEFAPLSGGAPGSPRCGYDILLAATDPALVVMELDLYWIRKGGQDPLRYFREYKDRFRLVHVKDMGTDGGMVDLGTGVIDWPVLLRAASEAGVRHFIAEHDTPRNPLAFARMAFNYLRSLQV